MSTHDFAIAHAEHIPGEAAQFGAGCACGKRAGEVVYIVTTELPAAPNPLTGRTMPALKCGPYCFHCLKLAVKASGRIPVPMEENLFEKLRAELTGELVPGRKLHFMMARS